MLNTLGYRVNHRLLRHAAAAACGAVNEVCQKLPILIATVFHRNVVTPRYEGERVQPERQHTVI
jgi:hypothetical protein